MVIPKQPIPVIECRTQRHCCGEKGRWFTPASPRFLQLRRWRYTWNNNAPMALTVFLIANLSVIVKWIIRGVFKL